MFKSFRRHVSTHKSASNDPWALNDDMDNTGVMFRRGLKLPNMQPGMGRDSPALRVLVAAVWATVLKILQTACHPEAYLLVHQRLHWKDGDSILRV